jgi:hypothetical protein
MVERRVEARSAPQFAGPSSVKLPLRRASRIELTSLPGHPRCFAAGIMCGPIGPATVSDSVAVAGHFSTLGRRKVRSKWERSPSAQVSTKRSQVPSSEGTRIARFKHQPRVGARANRPRLCVRTLFQGLSEETASSLRFVMQFCDDSTLTASMAGAYNPATERGGAGAYGSRRLVRVSKAPQLEECISDR